MVEKTLGDVATYINGRAFKPQEWETSGRPIIRIQDCQNDGIEFIDIIDDVTRIRFDVLDFEEEMADEDRKKAIVPFQLAYAVSIHKAQGLEYRSVKVVIPSSNAEKITHGIFYTAITRAKEKLKIYWSSETMQEVVAGFSVDTSRQKSLAIIKEKLKQDKNT